MRRSPSPPRLLFPFVVLAVASVPLAVASCGGDGDGNGPTEPPAVPVEPASVSVAPGTLALEALGASARLTASVLDAGGNAISGAAVTWSSQDEAVATVDGAGTVTAVGVGSTTVSAASGALTGTASVTVTQLPASVAVEPESVEVLPDATATLTAAVADANGNAVPAAEVVWSSSDEAVATVDGGTVTGVAEGTATVTATSGPASGEATVTVPAPPPDLTFDTDGTLGGMVNAGSVTIQPGVTVTLTEDLMLNTTGGLSIEGTLTGDCVVVDALIGGDLTLDGATLDTSCGVPPRPEDAPGLTLEAAGAMTLQSSQVRAAGDVLISNDPDFEPGEDTPFAPAASRSPLALGRASSRRPAVRAAWAERTAAMEAAGEAAGDCFLDDVTIDVEKAAAAESEDVTGSMLLGSVHVACNGDLVAAGVTLEGRDGADGEPASVSAPSPVAEARDGSFGGAAVLTARGEAVLGGVVQLLGGDGGNGGTAIAIATEPGGSAEAEGGDGGLATAGFLQAAMIVIPPGGELVIGLGRDGNGGAAGAQGGNGDPGQAGGGALALAGEAGFESFNSGTRQIAVFPRLFQGALNAESRSRVRILPIVTGDGGEAEAVSGRGGDGPSPGAPGAPGGRAVSVAGDGGSLAIKLDAPLSTPVEVTLGDGGNATWRGGMGGNGAPGVCIPGGAGGKGGDAQGAAGGAGTAVDPTGFSVTPGAPGAGTLDAFGNGGDGADGTGGGDAGPGGDNGTGAPEGGVAPDPSGSFQPGSPGDDLLCSADLSTDVVVASDPNGHDPFIQVSNVTSMTVRRDVEAGTMTVDPAGMLPALSGSLAAPASARDASGRTPGARADLAFTLTGTGTIVGIPGVVVTFTGTLTVDDATGRPTAIAGELTVDANNDRLPPNAAGQRNPAVYQVTGSGG